MVSSELLIIGAGAMVSLGVVASVAALRAPQPRLSDALSQLSGETGSSSSVAVPLVLDASSRLERVGAWVYRTTRVPLSDKTAALLLMQGRSVGDFFLAKMALALAGFLFPLALAMAFRGPTALTSVPLLAGLLGAALGWLWPGIQLRSAHDDAKSDAQEAIHTYMDLVLLERLANKSSIQALESAAEILTVPTMAKVRSGLHRARLEQRPPWSQLRSLSDELELPELADIADVMRLDDQGAALADGLAARVRELRDARLTAAKQRAHQLNERMTVWMSLPVLIFALAFICPPMLRMAGIAP